jgi:hypothetical protein
MEHQRKSEQMAMSGLMVAGLTVALSGAFLVAAPMHAQRAFSLLVYFEAGRVEDFGPEALRYIKLAHAVMGALMVGWGVMIAMYARAIDGKSVVRPRVAIGASLVAWFVPDTAYSLLSGFWPNAVLNTAFMGLFAVPLLMLRRAGRDSAAAETVTRRSL